MVESQQTGGSPAGCEMCQDQHNGASNGEPTAELLLGSQSESSIDEEHHERGFYENERKRRCHQIRNATERSEKEIRELVGAALQKIPSPCDSSIRKELMLNHEYAALCHPRYSLISSTLLSAFKLGCVNDPWDVLLDRCITLDAFSSSEYAPIDVSIQKFTELLEFNDIQPKKFVNNVYNIINKNLPKVNSLILYGQANSGKTLLLNSIAKSCLYYSSIQQFAGKSQFEFAPFADQRVVLINEPLVTDVTIETVKNLMEGQTVEVDKKYSAPVKIERTPLLISSNTLIHNYLVLHKEHADHAIRARSFIYTMKTCPMLKDFPFQFNPAMWKSLVNEYVDE